MPHLNELNEQFEQRGLSILGVTEESRGMTTPWIEEHEVQYPYAFDKTGSVMGRLGLSGYPSAALIDVSGKIVWTGHPARLKAKTIEKALGGQPLTRPLFRLEGYTPELRQALFDEEYGQVYKQLGKVNGEDDRAELGQALDLLIDRRLDRLDALFESGDYLAVKERTGHLVKAFKKLPQEARVAALAKRLKGRAVTKVIKAQEKVRKLVPDGARIAHKDRAKIAKDLNKIIAALPETAAARDAQAALDWIGA